MSKEILQNGIPAGLLCLGFGILFAGCSPAGSGSMASPPPAFTETREPTDPVFSPGITSSPTPTQPPRPISLTGDDVSASYPVWSPDGKEIVYLQDQRLWKMNRDGSGQRSLGILFEAGAPKWSPDGAYLAFSHSARRSGFYVVKPDGDGLTRIGADPEEANFPVYEWSSDGKFLAYVSAVGRWSALQAWEASTKRTRTLYRTSLPVKWLRWEDRGTMVIYADKEGEVIPIQVDLNGAYRTMPSFRLPDAAETFSAALSPDGSAVAFITPSEHNAMGPLWVMTVADSQARRLTQTNCIGPKWSPDGRRLIFTGSSRKSFTLEWIGADGSNPRTLVEKIAWMAWGFTWSPDGGTLAYVDLYGRSDSSVLYGQIKTMEVPAD
jgi:Tol biopolymer transport system component